MRLQEGPESPSWCKYGHTPVTLIIVADSVPDKACDPYAKYNKWSTGQPDSQAASFWWHPCLHDWSKRGREPLQAAENLLES